MVLGESLGTGLATYLASKRKLEGLILYASYPSLLKVASSKLKIYPLEYLLKYPIPADNWAPSVRIPVLSIHGAKDTLIPIELGKEQSDHFPKATFFPIQGANHNDWLKFVDGDFVNKLNNFVQQSLKGAE